ncbi:MAG: cupin domain-containing protein [Chitinophagaceae bacterium]|nr:cupin domain-containing protein [Chitinophagaceae bacterium]MCW5904808.1 cupin domain-containing protein [Chitinophagaceae bacterium]
MLTAKTIIEKYQLLPHPEGGFYKETYRSAEFIQKNALPERFSGDRHFSTAIYFLLEQGNFSAFHKIKSDECWHFYTGQSLLVYIITPTGALQIIRLGSNVEQGEVFQYVVPANCWFASEPAPETDFSFVGCTVAPGFDFTDFELANATTLALQYPQHESIIKRLCR